MPAGDRPEIIGTPPRAGRQRATADQGQSTAGPGIEGCCCCCCCRWRRIAWSRCYSVMVIPVAERQGCSRMVGCTNPSSVHWARPTPPAEAVGWPTAHPARFASPPGPAGCNATRRLPAPRFRFESSSSSSLWAHRRPPASLVCWVRLRGHYLRHCHHHWGCDFHSPTCSCCRRRRRVNQQGFVEISIPEQDAG